MPSYDYRRSASLTPGLAVAVALSLVADSALLLLLFFLDAGFSTEQAYRDGIRGYAFSRSVSDVVLLQLCKACILCGFWSLACLKPAALASTLVSLAFAIAKLAAYDSWHSAEYAKLPILLVPLPTSVIECVAVARTRYTWADPDWPLAEQVEREQEAAAAASGSSEEVAVADDYALLSDGQDSERGERGGDRGGQQQRSKQQQQRPPSMLYLLFRYAQPDYGLLIAGLCFIILSSLFKLAIPNFASKMLTLIIEGATATATATDSSSNSKASPVDTIHTAEFTEAAFYFALSAAGLAVFAGLRIWCTAKAEVRLVARLQRILFMAIVRQDIAFFDANGTGALTSRLTSDCTLLGSIFTTNVNVVLQSGINLVGSTAYLFVLDARLAGAYLALVLLFTAITRTFGAYAKRLQKQIQSLKAEANQIADQSIALVRLVRAFASEDWEKRRYDARTLDNVAAELRVKMLYAIYVPLVFLIENGLVLTVVLLGGHLVARGGMPARSLTAFYFYSQTITTAMQSLADNILSILTGLGAGSKVMEIIRHKPSIPIKGGLIPRTPSGITSGNSSSKNSAAGAEVVFEDVSLAYPVGGGGGEAGGAPTVVPIIEHLNLHIRPGERVAIVGLSGSGKSSLISLLLRYYSPTAGRVLFDGADVVAMNPVYLKAQMGVVTQDPMLFGVSIRDNIAYGQEGADDLSVEKAARMAAIHDFITTLPQGYATVVGERGVTLSGGERQRVGIARALLRKPRLLILDEATSALDAQRESEVQEALKALHKALGLTLITIAHRLSTVVDADRILVMSKGRIIEQGTHAELLARDGVYKELVLHQLQEEALRDRAGSVHSSSGGGGVS